MSPRKTRACHQLYKLTKGIEFDAKQGGVIKHKIKDFVNPSRVKVSTILRDLA